MSLVHYLERNLCIPKWRMNDALLRFLNIYVRTDLRTAPNVLPNVITSRSRILIDTRSFLQVRVKDFFTISKWEGIQM